MTGIFGANSSLLGANEDEDVGSHFEGNSPLLGVKEDGDMGISFRRILLF